MQLKQLVALSVLALTMAACGTSKPASVSGGECRVFERPQYVVLGRTSYDQNWIDGNTEAGVAACGWDRPAKRPETLQQARPVKPKAVKRRSVLLRIKAVVTREQPAPEPVPLPPAVAPVPHTEAKTLEPFDELLFAPEPPAAAVKPKRKRWWGSQ